MKIAMPTMGDSGFDEKVGEHFGRCSTFTIYDSEKDDVKVISNNSRHKGGKGNPPDLLAKKDVDVMICRNLGKKAVSLFEKLGIDVYSGARGTVKESIESWEKEKLEKTSVSDTCDQGKHYP
ncbi:MAG: NifB/NifX family molybdenum-iron cluster-binding protein [Candidatus Saliniplasma sp.]